MRKGAEGMTLASLAPSQTAGREIHRLETPPGASGSGSHRACGSRAPRQGRWAAAQAANVIP